MKKILSILCAVCMAAALSAEEYRGVNVAFPNANFDAVHGSRLYPKLAVAAENKDGVQAYSLVLRVTSTKEYKAYDNSSRLLLRFADSTKMVLPRVAEDPVQKETFNNVSGQSTFTYYSTFTHYQLKPEFLEKLQNGIGIIKIRVVYAQGDAKDYDMTPSYGVRVAKDLYKSYNEATAAAKKNNTNLSDDDF